MTFRLTTLGRLSIDGSEASGSVELRPQRLAFLAMLAAAGANGLSRDRVIGVLWADSDPERARHSLAQMLYRLRREAGEDVVVATPTLLRLNAAQITSDIEDFRAALGEQRWEAAAELFSGPFLDAFYLPDAPEFERWSETTRSAIGHDAMRAIENAAQHAVAAGRTGEGTRLWRRLTQLDPTNGRFASSFIEQLLAAGDRAGALLHAQSHAELVRRELEIEPEPSILAVIDGLRAARPPATPTSPPPRKPVESPVMPASDAPPELPAQSARSRRRPLIAPAVLVGAIVVFIVAGIASNNSRALRRRFFPQTQHGTAVRSPVAARLYEDGLRAFDQFDLTEASRLFDAAIKEDSTFALAAYFRWRVEVALDGARQDTLAARASVLAEDAGERDRALILEHLAAAAWDPRALATADSLATRFPTDVDVLMRAADVAPELPRAVVSLDSAIARDSTASTSPSAPCRRCEALEALARRYARADSMRRADETLDRWSAMRPADYQPWLTRADIAMGLGRRADVEASLRRADSLGAPRDRRGVASLVRHLRFGDIDSATASCTDGLRSANDAEFARHRRLCTISLRMQGRYRDALVIARGERIPGVRASRQALPVDREQAAILDLEMHRPASAALGFAPPATAVSGNSATTITGASARAIAGALTLSAMASAMSADTLRVRALVDSVELIGHRSLDPRDPLLHRFLRGLLSAAAGEHERAVVEFRAALASSSPSFTRINYEMGKSLLALQRPAEAIAVLRSALRAGVDGPALYLTATDVHELLAQAFVAANQPDSATAHYSIVERWWRSADPTITPRYELVRQWLLRSGGNKR